MRRISMIAAFCALFTWAALAQNNNSYNSGAKKHELSNAAQTVQQMTSSKKVPKQLIDQAECIAVIPNLTKGALIVGGEHGSGVVSCRKGLQWSAPAFINVTGDSIGLQAGGSNSQILLLMNKEGEQDLLTGNFQLSANAVAAGPNGSNYNASAGWTAPVLSYKRSNGAYAGVDIKGSQVSVDKGAMKDVYGSQISADKVLTGTVQVPEQAEQFVHALPSSNQMG